ncbi:MAG: beta-N-acetylhexosaminidase [Myxococcales bacterium]|nr:beta-N-acetylhexosaminidase [Myxococcales bacterium]
MNSREIARLAGRHFVIGFDGTELSPEVRRALQDWNLAGAIVFRRNIESPRQLLALARELQADAEGAVRILAIDQEGGRVARLSDPFTVYPPVRSLGNLGKEELARAYGLATGRELAAVGVNLDFAPVLDIDSNPANPIIGDRSFSRDPARVGAYGLAFWQGLAAARVVGCGKHFPGHGDTSKDSHLELPRVDAPLGRLREVELAPFAHAIGGGVDVLMTAHVVYPAVDPARPASLSPRWLGEILRRELAYEGVIVSDDLEMKAVSASASIADASVEALAAGSDLLLVCEEWRAVEEAIGAIARAVEAGTLDARALEASAARVARVRARLIGPPKDEVALRRWIGCEGHQRLAEQMRVGLALA